MERKEGSGENVPRSVSDLHFIVLQLLRGFLEMIFTLFYEGLPNGLRVRCYKVNGRA